MDERNYDSPAEGSDSKSAVGAEDLQVPSRPPTITGALAAGLGRLLRHQRYLAWLYLANFALALIPAFLVSSSIEKSVEQSQMAERLRVGFDDEWHREFRVEAQGFPATFTPAVTGLGAVLDGIDAFVSGKIWNQYAPIVGLGLLLLLLWTFATGGILQSFQSPQISRGDFWAACGRYFGPLVRLLLLAALFYLVAYKLMLPWVDHAIQTVNRQTIDERIAFAWVLAKYLLVLGYVFLVNLVFDYAKVICVAENRRSALGAAAAALAFVRRRPLATIGLYAVLGVMGIALILLYALVAPGALQDSYLEVLLAFVLGQAFILGRIGLRLYSLSAQSQLYVTGPARP